MSFIRESALTLLLVAGGLSLGCRSESKARPRVLLVGVDGLEWSVAAPMIAKGELPNLGRIVSTGVFGSLQVSRPALSPILWTTIATGTDDHGITGFTVRGSEPPRLASSGDRRAKAFWDILSEHDRRVATVGWWLTWPVEPVNGVMVAQVNTAPPDRGLSRRAMKGALFRGLDRQVFPSSRENELLGFIEPVEREFGGVVDRVYGNAFEGSLDPIVEAFWRNSLWSVRADELYLRIGLHLLEDAPYDVFALYFGATDVLSHRFWRYMRPEDFRSPPSPDLVERYGDVIRDAYREVDRSIGRLMAAAPKPTTVIVVSDHGAHSANWHSKPDVDHARAALLSGDHDNAPDAFFAAMGPGIRARSRPMDLAGFSASEVPRLGSLLDVLPTLLALAGAPLARDAKGAPLKQVLDPAWLAAHPVSTVGTHTPAAWREARHGPAEDPRAKLRLEQLRALGYVEGP